MFTVNGEYNSAVCYAVRAEESTIAQLKSVCDQETFAKSTIRVMPDAHAGDGVCIGTTMSIIDKVVPGMVGVDIGCGMHTVRLDADDVDFARLDEVIRKYVPAGFEIHGRPHRDAGKIDLSLLRCARKVNYKRGYSSIGTLGGGNHFIEVDRGEDGGIYLVVHSGSRHLGLEVAKHYQSEGAKRLRGSSAGQVKELIATMKEQGRQSEIEGAIKDLNADRVPAVPEDLAWVEGELFDDYIHDMKIMQDFAAINRRAMVDTILVGMRLGAQDEFATIHNYIDTESMILRKGAVSAREGERLIIPINMRDGSLICVGKGNPEWNWSAPHGAGRLMSRREAFKELTMDVFQDQMKGIYSSSVVPETIDESPMAYKPMEEITSAIGPTVDIVDRIKPVYNFKAAEQARGRRRR